MKSTSWLDSSNYTFCFCTVEVLVVVVSLGCRVRGCCVHHWLRAIKPLRASSQVAVGLSSSMERSRGY
eukprot:SAG31_NODE_38916_length_292_cov_0.979275_1_plen_67_part_10